MVNKKIPMRTCVGCRNADEKRNLIRVVRTPEGEIKLDKTGKLSGRGAYICKKAECLIKAQKAKSLSRALEVAIPADVYEALRKELESIEQ